MDRYNGNLHIIKHLHLGRSLRNNFNELVIADTFRLLALSMISVFIPIFLLDKINISAWNVAWFELLTFILSIYLHFKFIPLTGRIGVKKIMVLSYLINSLTCLILYFGVQLDAILGTSAFIILIAIFNSLPLAMYWNAHHIYFLQSTSPQDEGAKLGLLESIPLVISIAGPFIGGLLIFHYSFREVFLFSTVLLVAAAFSLFFTKDIKIEAQVSWKKTLDAGNFKKNAVFFLQGLGYCATSFIWPVLLFLNSINLVAMGSFYLLSNLLNATMVYFGGKNADLHGEERILKVGAVGHSLSMILRALSSTALFMATFQSMGGLFGGLLHLAIDASFYKNSHKDIGNAIMNREFYMHLGRITTVIVLVMAMAIFDLKIAMIFTLMIAGVATFLLLLILKSDYSFMGSTPTAILETK